MMKQLSLLRQQLVVLVEKRKVTSFSFASLSLYSSEGWMFANERKKIPFTKEEPNAKSSIKKWTDFLSYSSCGLTI